MSADSDCYIHTSSEVGDATLGSKTRVWQNVVILDGALIGEECNICANCFIENDVVVGDRVTVKCGVQLWDGLRVEDDVFIGPNATFCNDMFPRSKQYQNKMLKTIVRKGVSIGANSTILPGVELGEGCFIGAGSVVTKSVPPGELWLGNPARFIRRVDSD